MTPGQLVPRAENFWPCCAEGWRRDTIGWSLDDTTRHDTSSSYGSNSVTRLFGQRIRDASTTRQPHWIHAGRTTGAASGLSRGAGLGRAQSRPTSRPANIEHTHLPWNPSILSGLILGGVRPQIHTLNSSLPIIQQSDAPKCWSTNTRPSRRTSTRGKTPIVKMPSSPKSGLRHHKK